MTALYSNLEDLNLLNPVLRDAWCVLGLPFDAVSLDKTASLIDDAIEQRKSCFLSTPNLNFVIAAEQNEQFFQSVLDSDISVADGMPIVWVAKLLGIPLLERVAGSSLFDVLSRKDRTDKIKIFFFGGENGIAERAFHRLNETSIGMRACGFHDPGFVSVERMSSPEIIEIINQSEADFLVVALGAQKGQEWILKNQQLINVPVVSHLGAVINFVAGSVERAPEIWQRCGLEWVWRIRQEPKLWRRYFFDGCSFFKILILRVFPLALHNIFAKHTHYYHREARFELNDEGNETIISMKGTFKADDLTEFKSHLYLIIDGFDKDVVMDCVNLEYIDSAGIATLLLFQSELIKRKRKLRLERLSSRLKWIFRLNGINKKISFDE